MHLFAKTPPRHANNKTQKKNRDRDENVDEHNNSFFTKMLDLSMVFWYNSEWNEGKIMTVQDLIDRLQSVQDKSKTVWVYSYDEETIPDTVMDNDDGTVLIVWKTTPTVNYTVQTTSDGTTIALTPPDAESNSIS